MRVLVATDAWHPQVNGVVTTLSHLAAEAPRQGAEIRFITPQGFPQVSCPGYPEIRLALPLPSRVARIVAEASPDFIHIATEGPIGWSVRRYCMAHARPFTTSFHTRFPEYAAKIGGIPSAWVYWLERQFHRPSCGIMTATRPLEAELAGRGFSRLLRWSRGVDAELFKPSEVRLFGSDAPVFLYVGRVSREKNIEEFLDLDLPGRKVVVGAGPYLGELKRRYPDVTFAGRKRGADLAACYASADVFVFPSRTDTFGLVLLEALASGVPVAAYPVTGPIDVVENGKSGILDEDLGRAARGALGISRAAARKRALEFTWAECARQFLSNVASASASATRKTGLEGPRPGAIAAHAPPRLPLSMQGLKP